MKREIEIFEHAGEVVKALKTGVLLTTKAENKVNSMTIGWGTQIGRAACRERV